MTGTTEYSEIEELEDGVLPLDAWHRAQGARMVSFAGYLMPIQYEGIMAEHVWTREHAGLFDVSHMGQLFLSGEGLDEALEGLIPADVKGLGLGRLRYSMLLDDEGGILDDLIISRWADGIYVVVNGAMKADDIAWMREHLPDDITMNHLEDHALLALQGPEAAIALARHVAGEQGLDALGFMTGGRYEIAGIPVWISRSGYTGEDGFELSIPAASVEAIATLLTGEPEVKPIGLGARDSLRLEAGLPLYGHDLDTTISPVGAGLTFALSKRRREEGGFPGHARIMAELADGAPVRWVGLKVGGRLPVREGAEIFVGETSVGKVTSGGFAPTVGGPVAAGWVDASVAAVDAALEIEVRGKRIGATVAAMPFVPHRYYRKPTSIKGDK